MLQMKAIRHMVNIAKIFIKWIVLDLRFFDLKILVSIYLLVPTKVRAYKRISTTKLHLVLIEE